jgi:hypothetical protein
MVSLRVIAVVIVVANLAAQQDAGVPFQSRFVPSPISIWREALIGLSAGLVWYGTWRGLARLVKREQMKRTKTLRYLVPTAMLAGSWVVLLALSGSRWPTQGVVGLLLNAPLFLFILADAPALLLSGGLLNLAVVAGLPPLYQGLMGSAVAWLAWFGIIRLCEWRCDVNARVSLRIAN